jgi:hypothetical protein
VDTRRQGEGPCVSGVRSFRLAGVGGVPADAAGVALNVTVTAATSNGYLTVYPAGVQRPVASNLNYARRQTVPNAVLARVGANGHVDVFAPGHGGCPDVVIDVFGYFAGSGSNR